MSVQDTSTEAAQVAENQAEQASQGTESVSSLSIEDSMDPQVWIDLGTTYGIPVLKALALLLLTLMIAGWVRKMVIKITSKAKVEITLAKFFGNLAKWAVMVLGVITIMGVFDIETTSFAAVIAAVGFAIGMALSGTIGNVASGVLLLVFRPFKVGDVVNCAGITAKVYEIGLFTTTFDTPDNRHIIVPNGAIFGSTIENITYHSTRRVDVAVGISYDADIDTAREVLEKVAANVEGGLKDPEPVVYLTELGGSSVDFSIRVWSATADYWAVRQRITRDIKYGLDAAGIGIPYPQRDVHIPGGITVKIDNA